MKMHTPHDIEKRIAELEGCITANDAELQQIYQDNARLQGENDQLRKAIRDLKEVARRIFDIADSGVLMELTVEKKE